ncbi:MAG: hypothetical protein AAB229_03655 [Candidatus Hydrogenedentota bacterium]
MKLTPNEDAVLSALQRDHTGSGNGIGGKALQEKLDLPNRRLRETIEALIKTHRVPIGADPVNGYFIIANEAEFEAARHELTARIVALSERLKALETAFRQSVALPRQSSLFEDRSSPCA